MTSTSLAGDVTGTDPESSFTIDSGIGNEAKPGFVIFLDDAISIERD